MSSNGSRNVELDRLLDELGSAEESSSRCCGMAEEREYMKRIDGIRQQIHALFARSETRPSDETGPATSVDDAEFGMREHREHREAPRSAEPSPQSIKPDPVAELCASIKENIRLCDHGYIHITCGQCVATWLRG